MVWTPTGPKRIDSIKPGDKVYSFNTDYGRLDIAVVEEVFDNGEMEVCEVISKTGHRSISTLDHNYFTYDGETEAQTLTSNDRLIEVNDWERIGTTVNKSEAIVLGEHLCSQLSEEAEIPAIVFSWDNDSIKLLLKQLLRIDWYKESQNLKLLHQIKQLLSRFNINSEISHVDCSKYKLYILADNADCLKGQIEKVIRNGRKERVYDLKVPSHHNYVVDGAVVHNSGISKISGAFATWFAMFHSHKTILIVSRTNDDAMGFLRENIVFLYENLPEWMVEAWKPIKQNEHEIIFPNGSKIKSLTSHPDVLRSNASSLNIIDEAAFIQGMDVMWAGGWPCRVGNTLIQTEEGLQKIESFDHSGAEWQKLEINVATDDGYKLADKLHVPNCGSIAPTIKIKTKFGYEEEGTPHHRLRSINENGEYVWKQLSEFKPGDIICSLPGQFIGKRQYLSNGNISLELTPKLAEIIGLYVGDGTIYDSRPKRFKIHFDPQDYLTKDYAVDSLNSILNSIDNTTESYSENGNGTVNLRLNSAPFVDFLCSVGLKSKTCAQDAEIPAAILKSDRDVVCAFLRGLFDSDGWCYKSSTSLKLGFGTQSKELAHQVQILLHSLGILSKIIRPTNTEGRFGTDQAYQVQLLNAWSKQLFKEIGFLTARKQECLDSFESSSNHLTITHPNLLNGFFNELGQKIKGLKDESARLARQNLYHWKKRQRVTYSAVEEATELFGLNNNLSQLIKRGFIFDTVVDCEESSAKVFDISVPDNNTYLANGIVNHNTLQHGGNVIVISTCVAPDTIINTANGLCEIQDLSPDSYDGFEDGYYHADYNGPDIVGINGLENATKFYKRPREATKIVTTTCGYQLEASLRHKLSVVDGTTGKIVKKYVHELQIGDYLPVKSGQMVFGNDDRIDYVDPDKRFNGQTARTFEVDVIDENLAYMLGVLTAEGHVREEEVVLSCGDSEVLDRCESWRDLGWKRGRKNQDYATISRCPMFVRFLQFLGVELTTAPFKTIPRRLLKCSEPVIRSFLGGLFDGDGAALTRGGQVCYTSTSKKLIKQVRMLLFNYGIHTYLETSPPGTTSFTRSDGTVTTHDTLESYRLYVSNNFTNLFYDLIGFDLERKHVLQENKTAVWSELMPPVVKSLLKQLKDTTDLSIAKMTKLGLAPNVLYGTRSRITKNRLAAFMSKISYEGNDAYDSLIELLEYDWFNCITKLEESENEVYDFTLPSTHTFIGDCFININTNGLGNWYWATCTDAEAGANQFNPIVVNWWDMDWAIEYQDPLSLAWKRIAPRDGIRECTSLEDIERYGQYWSPWLEEQYRALQEQGEAWKFEQEILASFIGSGNTVLDKSVISYIGTTVKDPEPPEGTKVTGYQTYVHPVSGNVEDLNFNFREANEGLWIWKKPVLASPIKKKGNIIIDEGSQAHSYVMGVDIATGKGRDYSAIEVFDIDLMEQVAEFMARCLPRELIKYVDRIGRYYNNALAVVERNNGGDIVIDQLRYDLLYPRLWRQQDINDKPKPAGATSKPRPIQVKPYGWNTTVASKPVLNKFLIDFLRNVDGEGYTIYSKRLLKQLQTYVRKRDRSGRDTVKTEAEDGAGNFDDLVMACAMALRAAGDGHIIDTSNLIPVDANNDFTSQSGPIIYSDSQRVAIQQAYAEKGGSSLLMPMSLAPEESVDSSIQREVDTYSIQLGGIPISEGKPIVTPSKYYFERG